MMRMIVIVCLQKRMIVIVCLQTTEENDCDWLIL